MPVYNNDIMPCIRGHLLIMVSNRAGIPVRCSNVQFSLSEIERMRAELPKLEEERDEALKTGTRRTRLWSLMDYDSLSGVVLLHLLGDTAYLDA